jgi:MFS transporter, PAT family, solute carrier family 33 (acetyl-CoA transportor), member 1
MKTFGQLPWNDKRSILLLLILYTLQGIPMGLCGSIPIILRENGVTYENLSIFSLVSLPFSLKLLWAPLVDSIYISSIGRRKSWLLPIQTLSGLLLIFGSYRITDWIEPSAAIPAAEGDSISEDDDHHHHHDHHISNMHQLVSYFLLLYLLMATQDIAVDGWALTLLSKENVAYGTICNAIGQTFGYILANQGVLVFSDPEWCQQVLKLASPLVTLSSFMFFWGILFLCLTLVLFFATETSSPSSTTGDSSGSDTVSSVSMICKNYVAIYEICQLPSIQKLLLILFTAKISLAPCDAVSVFKLQEYGMPRSDIAILSPLLLIVSFSLPVLLGPMMAKQPLEMFWKGLILKLCSSICIWILFEFLSSSSPHPSHSSSHYPPFPSYFLVFSSVMIFNEISSNVIFNSQMSFFSQIADPSIGGTYMTLLNTMANLGSKWPNFLSLYLLPSWSTSYCRYDHTSVENQLLALETSGRTFVGRCRQKYCEGFDGSCELLYDGYTLQQHAAVLFGVLWLCFFVSILRDLEKTRPGDWNLPRGSSSSPRPSSSSHPISSPSDKKV